MRLEDMLLRLPLQAADLVADEVLKFDPNTPQQARAPVRALLDMDPQAFVAHIDADYLAAQAVAAFLVVSLIVEDHPLGALSSSRRWSMMAWPWLRSRSFSAIKFAWIGTE